MQTPSNASQHADLPSAIAGHMTLLHSEQACRLRAGPLGHHIWRAGALRYGMLRTRAAQGLHAILAAAVIEGVVEGPVLPVQILVPCPVRLLIRGCVSGYLHALQRMTPQVLAQADENLSYSTLHHFETMRYPL